MHKNISFESLVAVHTHTHTHTGILLNNKIESNKKARIILYAK